MNGHTNKWRQNFKRRERGETVGSAVNRGLTHCALPYLKSFGLFTGESRDIWALLPRWFGPQDTHKNQYYVFLPLLRLSVNPQGEWNMTQSDERGNPLRDARSFSRIASPWLLGSERTTDNAKRPRKRRGRRTFGRNLQDETLSRQGGV